MAAIAHTTDDFHCQTFVRDVQKSLPSYARPVFLRLSPEVDKTGITHSLVKFCRHLYIYSRVVLYVTLQWNTKDDVLRKVSAGFVWKPVEFSVVGETC